MKKTELLAPAGSLEKAKIAFMYGADAVYAGTSKLSLRTRAAINDDSLEETIKYAHSIGKKVYVALNIYAFDDDYTEIENQVKMLDRIGADAILASDVGVIDTIRRVAPKMEIHISTQANTLSLHAAKFWREYGAKRVVLSKLSIFSPLYNFSMFNTKLKHISNNDGKDEAYMAGTIISFLDDEDEK